MASGFERGGGNRAGGRGRRTGLALLRLLVTVLALAWLNARVDLRGAARALGDTPPWLLLAPTVLLLCNSVLHALRVQVLLGGAGVGAPLHRVLFAMWKASFLGLVLPSGGAELAKMGFLASVAGSAELATAAVLVARFLELVPWTLLLLWGLAWGLWARLPLVGAAAAVFAAAFSLVLVTGLVLARRAPRPAGPGSVGRWQAPLPQRLGQWLGRLGKALVQVGQGPRALGLALLLTAPFSLLNCFIVYLLVQGHGLPMSYLEVLAVVPAVDTLISLPITINGIGLREGLFVQALEPWGATHSVAVAIALTRWSGELGRGAVGGLVFLLDPGRGSTPSSAR